MISKKSFKHDMSVDKAEMMFTFNIYVLRREFFHYLPHLLRSFGLVILYSCDGCLPAT